MVKKKSEYLDERDEKEKRNHLENEEVTENPRCVVKVNW